jgi:UDP-2,3-diacylglucosamine hydrolase
MTTLFISDLHLDPSRPAVTRAFLQLLEHQARCVDALYILGDLFEAWIGDDDDSELNLTVIAALKALSDSGVKLYVMHGNRDFLIGENFCQQTGCQLLDDPSVVNLYGENVLLMHGDSLCTDDAEYMAFRAQCRNPAWQAPLLAMSLEQRRQFSQQLRDQSKEANSNKAEDIMDVNATETQRVLEQHQVALLIHGHTHRPAVHSLQTADGNAQRVVLGDWESTGWQLVYQPDNSFDLQQFDIAPS